MRRSTSARSVGFARSTSAIAAGEIPPTYKDCPASATRENFVRRREETGPSEQRDTYQRALLDSGDVCGDLDVSVCVRHRGDRAALLERRDRGPIRDSNGMEFEPSPNPLDWVSEGDLDRPRRCRREMRHPSEHRPQEHVAVRQAGGWISGHDEDRLPVDVAQGGRLAGFDRNPVEQDFAEGPDDVDDEVPFPRGRPAREDDEVVVESPTERRPNGGRSIGHPSEEDWLAAILARHGRHRVRVDVIDLSRLDPLTWRDELVARGQDRNRWPHECLELRPSDRREDSDLRGRHLLSRAHDDGSAADVRSAPHDILTHAHGSENLHGLAVPIRVFDADDGRGPWRDRGSGGHLRAASGCDALAGHVLRMECINSNQGCGPRLARLLRIVREDRVPIHRRAIRARDVHRRSDVLGRDAVQGLGERHGLRPPEGPHEIDRDALGLVKGDEPFQRPHPMPHVSVRPGTLDGSPAHRCITPIACPSSGRISFSMASRDASGDPGTQKTSRPWYTPATAPESIAALPIDAYERDRKSSPNPGKIRSNVGNRVGMVTSRFDSPVPPFVTMASQVQDACSTASRMAFGSSFTTAVKSTEWPDFWNRSRISLPDSSVCAVRLSEIVITAHFTEAGAPSLCFFGTAIANLEKTSRV